MGGAGLRAEGAAGLQVVGNVALLVARLQGHVVLVAGLAFHLNVNVRKLVESQGLALRGVQGGLAFVGNFLEASSERLIVLSLLLIVHALEECVVLVVGCQLDWVLIVREQ